MRLSIIIVNYNVEHFLEQCLLSARKACEGLAAEIIVVDNASVDGSLEMLRQKFPDITLIANTDNKGFSKANNQGIRIAQGEYILLLNPDTVVEEETFKTCVDFMDQHPDAGGLGVRMLDGKGHFLPESKRGLPTPRVAFYKIFGLSKLFPRSEKFNRYHMGHLPEMETHEVEILSGAFMFMRKSALDEIGLLDEDYFMYGEDIDLSYRLIKGGYKNYYTPLTRIIHYKGESTKKTSVNYVMVFYNAMRIFARKHFSDQHARSFSKLIELAIYARAFLSIMKRSVMSILHPLTDVLLIALGLRGLAHVYGQRSSIDFPDLMLQIALPSYAIIWVLTAFMSSGYESPLKDRRKLQGVLMGTGIILIIYSLLPESYRFSRAVILMGSLLAAILMLLTNAMWRWLSPAARSKDDEDRKYAIIGQGEEIQRIRTIMRNLGIADEAIHDVTIGSGTDSSEQIKSLADIYDIDEVIFCAKDIAAERIIDLMSGLDSSRLDFKIAPPESMFIIGSNSKDDRGDLLALEMNSISRPVNRRNKRILDFFMSLVILAFSPLLIWFQKKPLRLFTNSLSVLIGRKTWVGYHQDVAAEQQLPDLKKGVVPPESPEYLDEALKKRGNLLYAKGFQSSKDIDILTRMWRYLGS